MQETRLSPKDAKKILNTALRIHNEKVKHEANSISMDELREMAKMAGLPGDALSEALSKHFGPKHSWLSNFNFRKLIKNIARVTTNFFFVPLAFVSLYGTYYAFDQMCDDPSWVPIVLIGACLSALFGIPTMAIVLSPIKGWLERN